MISMLRYVHSCCTAVHLMWQLILMYRMCSSHCMPVVHLMWQLILMYRMCSSHCMPVVHLMWQLSQLRLQADLILNCMLDHLPARKADFMHMRTFICYKSCPLILKGPVLWQQSFCDPR